MTMFLLVQNIIDSFCWISMMETSSTRVLICFGIANQTENIVYRIFMYILNHICEPE